MKCAARILEPFGKQWAILLTTYRRDGTPVDTAVNVAMEAFVRATSGKRAGSAFS